MMTFVMNPASATSLERSLQRFDFDGVGIDARRRFHDYDSIATSRPDRWIGELQLLNQVDLVN